MEKMNTEKETYIQKTFFQTGAPPFAASLPFLIVSMYCLLSKKPLLWAVLLLVIGLLLIALGIKKAKQDTEHIRKRQISWCLAQVYGMRENIIESNKVPCTLE